MALTYVVAVRCNRVRRFDTSLLLAGGTHARTHALVESTTPLYGARMPDMRNWISYDAEQSRGARLRNFPRSYTSRRGVCPWSSPELILSRISQQQQAATRVYAFIGFSDSEACSIVAKFIL